MSKDTKENSTDDGTVIRLKVTKERFEEIISIDDSMYFLEISNKQAYDYMCQFVTDANDNYVTQQEARKMFKRFPRKEFDTYLDQFLKSVNDAFVNPQNGKVSVEPS